MIKLSNLLNEQEKFTARRKKSGNVSVFDSEEARDNAVKAGTHVVVKSKDQGDSKKDTPTVKPKEDSKVDYTSLTKRTDDDESLRPGQVSQLSKSLTNDISWDGPGGFEPSDEEVIDQIRKSPRQSAKDLLSYGTPSQIKLAVKQIQKNLGESITSMIRLVDLLNEESFDKKKLLKLIKKHDDAMITTSRGKEYVIYNPNNGNQDNTDMWDGNKSLFAVDSNGGEHEIRYKDITSFKA